MAVYTYDSGQVIVVVGGYPLSGFSDGSMVKVARDADAFTKVVGADGETTRTRSRNKAGSLTLTLAQSSPSNDILSGIALLDEVSNTGVVPVLIKDNSGRSLFMSAAGWVKKMPESEFGKDMSNREWVLDLADLQIFVGGNLATGVA